jgi:histone deacetylase complex regulatory component SIN3
VTRSGLCGQEEVVSLEELELRMIAEQHNRTRDGGPGCDAAASYVMRVKQRLGCEARYSHFIEILRQYHHARSLLRSSPPQKRAAGGVLLDAALVLEVNEKVGVIFAQYPDLLEGFRIFLPEAAMKAEPRPQSSHECTAFRETSGLC